MDIDLKLFSGRGGRGLDNIIPFPVPVLRDAGLRVWT